MRHKVLCLKIIMLLLLVLIVWQGWRYTKPDQFPIKQVKIIATYKQLTQQELHKIIALYTPHGFFYFNAFAMKHELLALPWVQAVAIKRKWPDTIIVNIVEQQAVLQWGDDALINPQRQFFRPPPATFPAELPQVIAPEHMVAEIFLLCQLGQQELQKLGLTIKKIIFQSQHFYEVLLSNNIMLYLKEENPSEQMQLFAKIYDRLMMGRDAPPKSVDLRYTNGLAIKWDEMIA